MKLAPRTTSPLFLPCRMDGVRFIDHSAMGLPPEPNIDATTLLTGQKLWLIIIPELYPLDPIQPGDCAEFIGTPVYTDARFIARNEAGDESAPDERHRTWTGMYCDFISCAEFDRILRDDWVSESAHALEPEQPESEQAPDFAPSADYGLLETAHGRLLVPCEDGLPSDYGKLWGEQEREDPQRCLFRPFRMESIGFVIISAQRRLTRERMRELGIG